MYQGITELYEKKPFKCTQSYFTALCGVRYSLLILLTLGFSYAFSFSFSFSKNLHSTLVLVLVLVLTNI